MIFTDHAILRYVQRVLGYKDKAIALAYIKDNKYEVTYTLLNLVNNAKVLYESFSYEGGGETCKYLIAGETLLVVSRNNNVLITMYDIKVSENRDMNRELVESYVREIKRNNDTVQKKNSKKTKFDLQSRNLEYAIKRKEEELAELHGELAKSIEDSRWYTTTGKELRHENRELMGELMYGYKQFRKTENETEKEVEKVTG